LDFEKDFTPIELFYPLYFAFSTNISKQYTNYYENNTIDMTNLQISESALEKMKVIDLSLSMLINLQNKFNIDQNLPAYKTNLTFFLNQILLKINYYTKIQASDEGNDSNLFLSETDNLTTNSPNILENIYENIHTSLTILLSLYPSLSSPSPDPKTKENLESDPLLHKYQEIMNFYFSHTEDYLSRKRNELFVGLTDLEFKIRYCQSKDLEKYSTQPLLAMQKVNHSLRFTRFNRFNQYNQYNQYNKLNKLKKANKGNKWNKWNKGNKWNKPKGMMDLEMGKEDLNFEEKEESFVKELLIQLQSDSEKERDIQNTHPELYELDNHVIVNKDKFNYALNVRTCLIQIFQLCVSSQFNKNIMFFKENGKDAPIGKSEMVVFQQVYGVVNIMQKSKELRNVLYNLCLSSYQFALKLFAVLNQFQRKADLEEDFEFIFEDGIVQRFTLLQVVLTFFFNFYDVEELFNIRKNCLKADDLDKKSKKKTTQLFIQVEKKLSTIDNIKSSFENDNFKEEDLVKILKSKLFKEFLNVVHETKFDGLKEEDHKDNQENEHINAKRGNVEKDFVVFPYIGDLWKNGFEQILFLQVKSHNFINSF
jgi:hypothetical protein